MRTLLLAGVMALSLGIPAQAEPHDFTDVIHHSVNTVILPAHAAMVSAATAQQDALDGYCPAPDADGLTKVRAAYGDLVTAFAAIEPYRFGPARTDNRFERLYFWPDRRGIGRKQINRILTSEDPNALDPAKLWDRSVAVQGLGTLDLLLFPTDGSDVTAFRCAFAASVAKRILMTSTSLASDWQTYAEIMTSATFGNSVYRSDEEVAGELLRAAAEQIEIANVTKLARPLGMTFDKAKPKRAPLWRSNQVIPAVIANLAAVEALIAHDAYAALLPEEEPGLIDELRFEFRLAREALLADDKLTADWQSLLSQEQAWDRINYARLPMDGARTLIGERLPIALDLTMGFNSLDGD